MRRYLLDIYESAVELNKTNILELVDRDPKASFLDLGCDDGVWTKKIASKMETAEITGVEIVDERLEKARKEGIRVSKSDLNETLPFEPNSFDVIHANQVIEHVSDVDLFASEIHRVLKPCGYAIVSTENGSSWHNIVASIMGWQIFSLTNVSGRRNGIGNPLAMHKDKNEFKSWTHKTIFNYLGLIEFFKVHDFEVIKILGAGYHPFPANLGRWDVRHSHLITIKVKKL